MESRQKLKLEELGRISVEEFKQAEKTPIIVVLDNIRSLNNIGSVFRTADAFRLEKIYLCGITATPPHREIQKTALGATDSVDWEYFSDATELVFRLNEENVDTYAIEQAENAVPLDSYQPDTDKKIAIVMGNEVEGVQQETVYACKGVIEIPQIGTKHSLNISVCTGVIIWDLFSKFKSIKKTFK